MKKLLSQLVILLVLGQFIGCGGDDASPSPSISLTIDGAKQSVKFAGAQLLVEDYGDQEGRSLNITAISGSNALTITVSNWSFQNPPEDGVIVKKYEHLFTDQTLDKGQCMSEGIEAYCDGGTVTYTSDDFYATAFYEGSYPGFVHITKCDTKSKRISGSYDVVVSNDTDEFTLKGEFKNIQYVVY